MKLIKSTAEKPRILVCQHGARRRYAVPRMLENAGMLAALYTDSSVLSPLGKCAYVLGCLAPASLQRLASREINGIPTGKIFSSDICEYSELLRQVFNIRGAGFEGMMKRHRSLSTQMKSWGLNNADVVYSMYFDDLDFIRWAKKQGAQSVVDVFVSPITDEIMESEYRRWPNWDAQVDKRSNMIKLGLWNEAAELADLLLCPSEWVAEGVRKISSGANSKIRVVPYGCSIDYAGMRNKPVKGRVLFAGGDPVRKGLGYLAHAAIQIKKELPWADFRVAGALPDSVIKDPICSELTFLGKLTSSEMKIEYLSADVFVLPSLSEGFAGVVAEAIGAGCPVIVTKEAGSPVVHEREGLIIPSRNVDALVAAIRKMVVSRGNRDSCSEECLKQIQFYSETAWQKRLTNALLEIA